VGFERRASADQYDIINIVLKNFSSAIILLFIIFLFCGCHATTPAPAVPVISSLTLSDSSDGSTTTTDELTVNVNISATGNPTEMMLSESSNFTSARTASWVDFHATGAFIFTGGAGTKTLYCKVKNSAGESNVASQSITYQPPPVPEHQWFTWWGGRTAHDDIDSSNAVMLDENAPYSNKSAGLVTILPIPGPQDDPAWLTEHLTSRVNQGYTKIFMENERGLSRAEIQAFKTWVAANPSIKIFMWCVSYNWRRPYGSPPTEGYWGSEGRDYFYWDEYNGISSNVIFCFQVYFSLHGVLDTDFTDDTVAATEERAWLDNHYMPFIQMFNLQNQCLFVVCLGGDKSQNPHFDLNDLTREMNLCKEKLPLGMGFFGTTDGWHSDGAIEAADNFCQAWLAE
jgi:hypothetical protein